MNTTTRTTAVVCFAAAIALLASVPTHAFDTDEVQCRATVAKAGTKLAKSVLKSVSSCHSQRNANPDLEGTDCNDPDTADPENKLPAAVDKFVSSVSNACTTQSPSTLLYEVCPGSCEAIVPALDDFSDVGDCLACVVKSQLGSFSAAAFTQPDPTLESVDAACHRSITKIGSKLVTSILKSVAKCQAAAEKGGATTTVDCTDTNYASLISDALSDAAAALESKQCSAVALPNTRLDACSLPDTVGELADCIVGAASADTQLLASLLLALPEGALPTTTTTTTSTSTTTLPPADPECPATADVVLYSRDTNQTCSDNGDCAAPRVCGFSGKCVTDTVLDIGWTGLGHGQDENSGDRLRLDLNCHGPADPTCGTCTVTGIDPQPGNCRCANDSRAICDDPLSPSSGDCAGAACNCYLGAPTPVSAGGTPFCMLRRLTSDVSGSIDVDAGAASLSSDLRVVAYLGSSVRQPCPTCGGTCSDNPTVVCDRDDDCGPSATCTLDPIAGDGLRGGTCTGGQNENLSCDVMASNASFPAVPSAAGGSGYSLDCMPSAGLNVSGFGLRIDLEQSTSAQNLSAEQSCGGSAPGEDCPCLLCSTDTSLACNGDSDCAVQPGKCALATGSAGPFCNGNSDCEDADAGNCVTLGPTKRCQFATSLTCDTNADCDQRDLGICSPSTCSARGNSGVQPLPNACDDLACTNVGGGQGECTTGPDAKYCDGVVRANGHGVLACLDDNGCTPGSIGFDAGECTIVERHACFLDPIVASGSPSPSHPVLAAAYCSPTTSNPGVNASTGLPGPVRSVQQTSLTSYCGSNPSVVYTPGAGGCP